MQIKIKSEGLRHWATIHWILIGVVLLVSVINTMNLMAAELLYTGQLKPYEVYKETEIKKARNKLEESQKDEVLDSSMTLIPVCRMSSSKSYMDYRVINEESQQRQIIDELTLNENGLLYSDDGYMAVALGSYFGELGSKYVLTLETGNQLKVIKVEAKADEDTINGCVHKSDDSVIEFVLHGDLAEQYWGVAPNGFINSGNFNNVDEFKGNIVKIEKLNESE